MTRSIGPNVGQSTMYSRAIAALALSALTRPRRPRRRPVASVVSVCESATCLRCCPAAAAAAAAALLLLSSRGEAAVLTSKYERYAGQMDPPRYRLFLATPVSLHDRATFSVTAKRLTTRTTRRRRFSRWSVLRRLASRKKKVRSGGSVVVQKKNRGCEKKAVFEVELNRL